MSDNNQSLSRANDFETRRQFCVTYILVAAIFANHCNQPTYPVIVHIKCWITVEQS